MKSGQKKASEVATALIKISVYVRRAEMRQRLERLAFRLVEDVACASTEEVNRTLDAIEGFVHLGRHLYEVEPMNAEIMLREIAYLRSVASDTNLSVVRGTPSPAEIESIFTTPNPGPEERSKEPIRQDTLSGKKRGKTRAVVPDDQANSILDDASNAANNAAIDDEEAIMRQDNAAIEQKAAKKEAAESGNGDENQAIRQSGMFERMRQFGDQKVQLKDIIAAFPGFSERTIRYDLHRLCSQGLLERVGPGGPGTYYRIRVV